jgi:hypothetical protein
MKKSSFAGLLSASQAEGREFEPRRPLSNTVLFAALVAGDLPDRIFLLKVTVR